jgi:hypothetical protein
MATCEVLTLDGDTERWDPLPPMHEARRNVACAAIGGCVIGFRATFPTYAGWAVR